MTSKCVYLRPVEVVFARAHGPYQVSAEQAWDTLLGWLDQLHLRDKISCGYGISRDNPRVVAPEKCRYDACVPMPIGFDRPIPEPFGRQMLPGGAYVRERHIGPYFLTRRALARIRDSWTPANGLDLDLRRPVVTIYLDDPAKCPEHKLRSDLCVPVASQDEILARHKVA